MKRLLKGLLCLVVVLAVIYLILIAPRMFNKPDMSGLEGYHYAHRGYFDNAAQTPENSLPAFQAAMDAGYGIELDIQLTSDGVPVVFHDASLARMCGVEGKIWDYSLAELQQMKLLETDLTIPTFAEVLKLIDGQVPIIVEYKMDKVDTAVCEKAHELLLNYEGTYCVQSFDPRVLLWYRQNAPEVVRGQLAQAYWKEEKHAGKPLYVALGNLVTNIATGPDYIAYKYSDAENISFKLCKLLGAKSAGWTIRSQADYESVKDEFDWFIFDSFAIEN